MFLFLFFKLYWLTAREWFHWLWLLNWIWELKWISSCFFCCEVYLNIILNRFFSFKGWLWISFEFGRHIRCDSIVRYWLIFCSSLLVVNWKFNLRIERRIQVLSTFSKRWSSVIYGAFIFMRILKNHLTWGKQIFEGSLFLLWGHDFFNNFSILREPNKQMLSICHLILF